MPNKTHSLFEGKMPHLQPLLKEQPLGSHALYHVDSVSFLEQLIKS
jgi:hypothetical protein